MTFVAPTFVFELNICSYRQYCDVAWYVGTEVLKEYIIFVLKFGLEFLIRSQYCSIVVVLGMMPCSLAGECQCFEGTYCVYLLISALKMETVL